MANLAVGRLHIKVTMSAQPGRGHLMRTSSALPSGRSSDAAFAVFEEPPLLRSPNKLVQQLAWTSMSAATFLGDAWCDMVARC